jgi:hypothetical protein
MKQYVTFDKEEFEKNLAAIRYAMYFLDGEIRVLEDYGDGKRIPYGIDSESWQRNAQLLSKDMRTNFENVREGMERFMSNIDFDFEGARKRMAEIKRNVLIEKAE